MQIQAFFVASLLAVVPTSTSATSLPNLCDDVYLDDDGVPLHHADGTTIARYCELTGPRAPVWAAPVCCSFDAAGADCSATGAKGCGSGQAEMWCDYGEQASDGSVGCYQPLPSTCDVGQCVDAPAGTTLEDAVALCCFPGMGCYELDYEEFCGGQVTFCNAPYTLQDGTVGCE